MSSAFFMSTASTGIQVLFRLDLFDESSGLQVGPTIPTLPYFFLLCSYFSQLFLEIALLSLLFHSEMTFFALFAQNLQISYYIFTGVVSAIHLNFNFLTKKVTLFC